MTTLIELDAIVTMLEDVADELGAYIHPDAALSEWIDNKENQTGSAPPQQWRGSHASQAVVDIIASIIKHGDEELVDAAKEDMDTDEGWQFWQHNLTFWIESDGEEETLVAWLGNLLDGGMDHVARSVIAA